jgi:hypothetical protein
MKRFYGLTGAKLNIAIAVVAGMDFALFGYGNNSSCNRIQDANCYQTKASWEDCLPFRLFYIISPKSTLQIPLQAVHTAMHPIFKALLWGHTLLVASLALSPPFGLEICLDVTNHFYRQFYHGRWSHPTGIFLRTSSIDCWSMDHWLWKWHEYVNVCLRPSIGRDLELTTT